MRRESSVSEAIMGMQRGFHREIHASCAAGDIDLSDGKRAPSSLSVLKLSFHISINVHKVHKTKDPENPSLVAFQNDGNDQVHHLRRETAQQKIPSGTFVRGSNFAEPPTKYHKIAHS